jgi:hypothetical protein
MFVSQEEFKKFLTQEQKKFILECIHGGLADYNNPAYYGNEARRDHTPSVRAQIRNCHIVAHAFRALIDRPDIRVINKRGRILFIFSDKSLVSIKKFDARLRTANAPTQQALAFKGQQPLDLDMPTPLINIFTGYTYDAVETNYEVYITCPDDEKNHWVWKISGAEITEFFSNSTVNADDIGTVHFVPKRRVRIRPDAQRKAKETG